MLPDCEVLVPDYDENTSQNWFTAFELPKFPLNVVEILKNAGNLLGKIPTSVRHKISQVLFDSISIHTL